MQTLTKLLITFLLISNVTLYAQGEDCSNALELLDPTSYCSLPSAYTNAGSLPSTVPVASCWGSGAPADVWFKFTALGTDVQLILITGGVNGTIKTPNIALYAGSCSGLNELACSKGTTNGGSLYKGLLNIGTTYLVRIATTAANRGSFKLCIGNYTPTVTPGADCDATARLCNKTEVRVGGLSGGGKSNEIEASSCLTDPDSGIPAQESNSAWYQWTCDQPGTLTFNIIPNDPTNDLDFILYELNGTGTNACGTRTILRCTATSCPIPDGIIGLRDTCTDVNELGNCNPPKGDGLLRYLDMIKGKTYVLMINNFSAASGYRITFGGTGTFAGSTPQAVITASSATACTGEPIIFSGNASVNYTSLAWTFAAAIPSSASVAGPHSVTYANAGDFTVILKATNAPCVATSYFQVAISGPPVPQVLNNVVHCEKDTIGPLTAKGTNGTFTWYADAMLTDVLHVGPVYTPVTTVTDTIYLRETINGCSSKAAMVIITIIKAGPLPLDEGFEGTSFPPADWLTDRKPGDTVGFKQNKIVGGFGTSTSCLSFDNYRNDLNGTSIHLNTPVYDFSHTTAPVLVFDVAYARRDSTHSDTLIVIVSDDCKGRGYTTVYAKGGKELATIPTDQAQSKFIPSATQWRRETIDMTPFAGKSSVWLGIQNLGHFGQPVYIDNIHIFETATAVYESVTTPELIISPNPVLSDVTIQLKTVEMMNLTWEICNVLGQIIKKESIKNSPGNLNRTIDLSDQPAGIYCITITYGSEKISRKLVKRR
jgi:hypothetical protein